MEEQKAELLREQEVSEQQRIVQAKRLEIKDEEQTKLAEIRRKQEEIQAQTEKQKKMIAAQAEAESIRLRGEAEAESIRRRAEAEAAGIRDRGLAEAEILQKKAEALTKSALAGKLKMVETLSQAQVASSAKVAEALGKNNKIMYLPSEGSMMGSFIPKLDGILQSDVLDDVLEKLNLGGSKTKKKK